MSRKQVTALTGSQQVPCVEDAADAGGGGAVVRQVPLLKHVERLSLGRQPARGGTGHINVFAAC